jgi:hypothetical protein
MLQQLRCAGFEEKIRGELYLSGRFRGSRALGTGEVLRNVEKK